MRTRHKALFAATAAAALVAGMIACSAPSRNENATNPSPPITTSVPPLPTSGAPPSAETRPVTAEELGPSWHPGCPVPPEQLRLVTVEHLGTDGTTHTGHLVVNQDRADQVVALFHQLRAMRYPVEKIQTPDHYPQAEDELSMADNNTSAFNCRGIPGKNRWSQHAWGRAVDINPRVNPYVDKTGKLQPKNGAEYLDRTRNDPGLLHDGDPAVRAFTDRGWTWGGHWTNPIDYQHFELP
jgi:hypothetical protein